VLSIEQFKITANQPGAIMASCSSCGSTVSEGAAYCSACGSPVSSIQGSMPTQHSAGTAGAGISSNVAAAISYLLGFITGILLLSIEPYRRNPLVRFHAFQSICFHVVITVLWIVWNNILWMGFVSLGFLLVLVNLVGALVTLGIILYWLFLMYKAYSGERYLIPMVGAFASMLANKKG
jgi:uncharacterized membrane protein